MKPSQRPCPGRRAGRTLRGNDQAVGAAADADEAGEEAAAVGFANGGVGGLDAVHAFVLVVDVCARGSRGPWLFVNVFVRFAPDLVEPFVAARKANSVVAPVVAIDQGALSWR